MSYTSGSHTVFHHRYKKRHWGVAKRYYRLFVFVLRDQVNRSIARSRARSGSR
jgi:hypothetical protein